MANHHRAIEQHYSDSSSHYQCSVCDSDEESWNDLLEHHRSTAHQIVCQGCADGTGIIWGESSKAYRDHLVEENVCDECEAHFASPSNLENHKLVHVDRSIECYGCDSVFKTYPHMILHIDSGGCGSNLDTQDLNMSAAGCFQWRKYIDEDYREEMLKGQDLSELYDVVVYPFRCPVCEVTFSKLSGLLQHSASQACNQTLESGAIGKLVRWLGKQHG
ncbi:hypothetical protein BKA66DRAFT_183810 [Pyrenochaeta sp. MPI-SDFR-AT-0127]|nr:hypothetical protein BKA66DRAFT_183810 [Pyrenochaeta sp. MPI-SDFR-AT-0127]